MTDREMVYWAVDHPVYMVDYFTSAVTLEYLELLWEEFQIPGDVELVVPGPIDLPSRPPLDHITLLAEFFRAGLRLPFHSFLRRVLQRLNVAPMQLNANAYQSFISCFVLWAKYFCVKLPFSVFHNLYQMKTAPSSTGSYYFQGHQRTFVAGCPDSDELQTPAVLCDEQMVVWSAKLHSGAIQEVGPPHIQKGLCVDKGATHEVFKLGKDREAPRKGGP